MTVQVVAWCSRQLCGFGEGRFVRDRPRGIRRTVFAIRAATEDRHTLHRLRAEFLRDGKDKFLIASALSRIVAERHCSLATKQNAAWRGERHMVPLNAGHDAGDRDGYL